MKKNMLGFAAILLAIVFSAFAQKNNSPANKTTEDSLFWYYLDESGNLGDPVIGDQMTKTEAMGEVPCDDETGADCARGYFTAQYGYGYEAPPATADDAHIQHSY